MREKTRLAQALERESRRILARHLSDVRYHLERAVKALEEAEVAAKPVDETERTKDA